MITPNKFFQEASKGVVLTARHRIQPSQKIEMIPGTFMIESVMFLGEIYQLRVNDKKGVAGLGGAN